MMDCPLLLKTLLWRAEHVFSEKEIVTWTQQGIHRYTYHDYAGRVRRLANALTALGIRQGDRVGTLAWNTYRHFEAYFAIPCMGAVLHTINLRLFPEQIAWIINHASDRILLIDADQLPLIERIRSEIPHVEAVVVFADQLPPTGLDHVYAYEELLAQHAPHYEFPELDENAAAGMCYTSATTGDPKGVLYSQRSLVLHSLVLGMYNNLGVREEMILLPAVPMFHVNSWGLPYAAAMQGTRLVLPGVRPTSQTIAELIEREHVTHAVGAVTVGIQLREFLESSARQYDLRSLQILWLGGQAPPRGLMEWWEQHYGVYVPQAWGMTEASPLATFTHVKDRFHQQGREAVYDVRTSQGLPLPLVEIKVADPLGNALPWDGKSVGEFMLRSPWVASAYYNDPERTKQGFLDGWFRTGDVGTINADGYTRLVDRTKDLIKSGGEWISSVDLENALMAHPQVVEAAVIAVPDPKWLERPAAYIVPRSKNDPPSPADLTAFLAQKFPKWWLPDEYIVIDELPKTGVGKFDKKRLRALRQRADESLNTAGGLLDGNS
ncbi:MAG: long-chain fatty acid--CoA ligase [Ktedonobacteraceae bacterium]|nr:long-chain fatty acid--CoA ligase [Ktedonobacteraceae bacterium]